MHTKLVICTVHKHLCMRMAINVCASSTFFYRIMLTCLFMAGVIPQGQLCVALYLEQHTKSVCFIRGTSAISRNTVYVRMY